MLEVFGVLPPSMAFVDGTIVLLPRMVDFSPGLSAAFFAVGSLMAIPMAVMLGSRLRDTVDDVLRHETRRVFYVAAREERRHAARREREDDGAVVPCVEAELETPEAMVAAAVSNHATLTTASRGRIRCRERS